jgi:uncharacterized membrane protein
MSPPISLRKRRRIITLSPPTQERAVKEWLVFLTENAALLIDAVALVVIIIGTIEAVIDGLRLVFTTAREREKRELWLRYARWLVAGLTFQLAADIIETSVSTSWEAVGRIAAIAAIRTFLNYFLERDMSEMRERDREREKMTA